jgi:hypothetical protein
MANFLKSLIEQEELGFSALDRAGWALQSKAHRHSGFCWYPTLMSGWCIHSQFVWVEVEVRCFPWFSSKACSYFLCDSMYNRALCGNWSLRLLEVKRLSYKNNPQHMKFSFCFISFQEGMHLLSSS